MAAPADHLPFDFTELVAGRHGLQPDAAAKLIAGWVSGYTPGSLARAMAEHQRLTTDLAPTRPARISGQRSARAA